MLLTANGDNIMETQKQSAIDSPFSACGESIEWGNDMRRKKSMWGRLGGGKKKNRTEKKGWGGMSAYKGVDAPKEKRMCGVRRPINRGVAIKLTACCKLTDGAWLSS